MAAPVCMGSKHRPASHLLKHIRGGRGEVTKGRKIKAQKREGGYIMQNTGCWWKRIACHSSLLVEGRDTPRRLMFDGTTAHKSPCPTKVNQDNMTWGWGYTFLFFI